jgi:hypothetical protein
MIWSLLLLLLTFAIPIAAHPQGYSEALPPHTVASNTSLAPKAGRRIEIHVDDPSLTKEQCKALIAHYHNQAAPDGQVSVQKPSALFGGTLQPWCVENLGRGGIFFNDVLFK